MFNGELFLDSTIGNADVPTEMAFYTVVQLLFGNALMLNLLIAIYGEIFSAVQETSDSDWKLEFCILVGEYQAWFSLAFCPHLATTLKKHIWLVKY